ncbi:hypothetical protein F2Q68_00034974 [Brassica cretica]|uniref:Uncharacterized protein n=1 Tax=Brassica cretica TaxID=69181 RepID=A0A8S9GZF4_BRACR|nr:hypothetical protein F2Q68_00034974 [Brassica cretica]
MAARSSQQSAEVAHSAGSLTTALSNLNLQVFPQDGTILPSGEPLEVVQILQGGLLRTISQLFHLGERLSIEGSLVSQEELDDLKRQVSEEKAQRVAREMEIHDLKDKLKDVERTAEISSTDASSIGKKNQELEEAIETLRLEMVMAVNGQESPLIALEEAKNKGAPVPTFEDEPAVPPISGMTSWVSYDWISSWDPGVDWRILIILGPGGHFLGNLWVLDPEGPHSAILGEATLDDTRIASVSVIVSSFGRMQTWVVWAFDEPSRDSWIRGAKVPSWGTREFWTLGQFSSGDLGVAWRILIILGPGGPFLGNPWVLNPEVWPLSVPVGYRILPLRSWSLSSSRAAYAFCRKPLSGLEGAGVGENPSARLTLLSTSGEAGYYKVVLTAYSGLRRPIPTLCLIPVFIFEWSYHLSLRVGQDRGSLRPDPARLPL